MDRLAMRGDLSLKVGEDTKFHSIFLLTEVTFIKGLLCLR